MTPTKTACLLQGGLMKSYSWATDGASTRSAQLGRHHDSLSMIADSTAAGRAAPQPSADGQRSPWPCFNGGQVGS